MAIRDTGRCQSPSLKRELSLMWRESEENPGPEAVAYPASLYLQVPSDPKSHGHKGVTEWVGAHPSHMVAEATV